MATVKSDQVTNITAEPRTLLQPNEEGRVYRAYFSVTVAGTETIDTDVWELARLPKGVRVLGGRLIHTDLGSAGDIDIDLGHRPVDGTGGDPDAFTATAIAGLGAGAGQISWGDDVVGDFGVEITEDSYLVGSLLDGGSGVLQAGSFKGYVDYLLGE